MGQKEIFNVITSVFQKSFVTFDVQKIRNEGYWKRRASICANNIELTKRNERKINFFINCLV